MYRIKSPREEYERVVQENTLAWSNDVLPNEPSERRRVGRRNITLPTLVPAMAPSTTAEWDLEAAEEPDASGDSEPEVCLSAL